MARTLAKQFAQHFEKECTPFQCALSTRAGTDCVGHMLHATTDADPAVTILSVDGIGAHDHIFRSAMLERGEDAKGTGHPSVRPVLTRNTIQLELVGCEG